MLKTRAASRIVLICVLGALGLALATSSSAQTPRNVLVVMNAASQDSVRVGEHYAQARGVPADQMVRLDLEPRDEIARVEYERRIEQPITAWLNRQAAQDRILYIVLTKGIPLRVAGTSTRRGTMASVDSELALLYRKMSGRGVPPAGPVPNPYFLGDSPPAEAKPFTHAAYDIFLVTRLDGFTSGDAMALVDRAQRASPEGRVVLDLKASTSNAANDWLRLAAERLEQGGRADRVTLDTSGDVLTGIQGVLGYYSWGSSDPAIKVRSFGLGFVPGAIGGMFVSSDARTFKEPPPSWTLGTWNQRGTWFEGAPGTLAGDLVREGITGVAAQVAEPYLDAAVRPQVLFPAYVAGFTLAEAFYLAMPYLSWQTIVVGDPLCRIGHVPPVPDTELDPPLDPATELPQYYAARRLEHARGQAVSLDIDALRLALKAEARTARGDTQAAEEALVEATKREPRLLTAQMLLALTFEQRGEYPRAIERYRTIVAQDGRNVVALNNLAYALAEREGKPADALPFAERAMALAAGSATVADTLGWTHYRLGNLPEATRYVTQAIKGDPKNPEIQLHAAVVFAAREQWAAAKQALARALEIDGSLATREDVKALQAKLTDK
jgi:uncharacterized protein (TIGR03790 family)